MGAESFAQPMAPSLEADNVSQYEMLFKSPPSFG